MDDMNITVELVLSMNGSVPAIQIVTREDSTPLLCLAQGEARELARQLIKAEDRLVTLGQRF